MKALDFLENILFPKKQKKEIKKRDIKILSTAYPDGVVKIHKKK